MDFWSNSGACQGYGLISSWVRRTFMFFIVYVHFCRQKRGLLEQFFLRMLVYHNPSDLIGIIPPIFLSLKTWTFWAIPIEVRDTGRWPYGFIGIFVCFIICVHFCRQKRGLLAQFFFTISIYHSLFDVAWWILPVFLSLKTWTFGAIPIGVHDTSCWSRRFTGIFLVFVVYVHFCR